jgi:hypothetical protein
MMEGWVQPSDSPVDGMRATLHGPLTALHLAESRLSNSNLPEALAWRRGKVRLRNRGGGPISYEATPFESFQTVHPPPHHQTWLAGAHTRLQRPGTTLRRGQVWPLQADLVHVRTLAVNKLDVNSLF